MRVLLRNIIGRLSKEIGLLLALLFIIGGTWAFIEIADEIVEGEAQRIDEGILAVISAYHPLWLTVIMRDVTALGSVAVLSITVLSVAGFLMLQRELFYMLLMLVASVCGGVLVTVLKMLYSRGRPDLPLHPLIAETSPGFPSGHAMMSAVVYLSLAVLLTRVIPSAGARMYVISVAAMLTVLIGLSRICLGVHYPSDVLAGWSIGLAWACLCWLGLRGLEKLMQVR